MSSSSMQNIDDILSVNITTTAKTPTRDYEVKSHEYLTTFLHWNSTEQSLFVEDLLKNMDSSQHGYINSFLSRMLRRDFIGQLSSCGLEHLAEKILEYLDEQSLQSVELVCREWYYVTAQGMLWKKLIERKVLANTQWHDLSKHRGWHKYLFRQLLINGEQKKSNEFYRCLYHDIVRDIKQLTINWHTGKYQLEKIQCHSRHNKGVYCLQYDDQKIICGLRDNTIQIWNRKTLECVKTLTGHNGSVLCLQYDDKVIITGSSDSTIRVWDIETGILINTLVYHAEAVLHLRFVDKIMMTCSKDRSIAVWEINSPADIILHRALVGHRAAVNVVDFDDKYIVSASGDRTIKVWKAGTFDFVRTLIGHRRGIACLQYRDQLVVSGSSDNTIRIWNIECGTCLRILEGHEELVRCVRFDSKLIVSGAYDGKIKIWDLQAALDPRSQKSSLCMKTFTEHTGRVFRLQFDEFQIVSSSHDDTIICFNFLQPDMSTSYIRHHSSDSTNATSISNVDHTQVASSTATVQSTQETLQRQNSNLSRSSSADSETSKKLDII
ncbi:unnamed protein product [Rotaria magnacalcarata]|uniref:F-box domain-containing protein n=5 Tax=Rotaria magnacalcarata TaxID=392030 RepID=A0A816X6G4_9BILA|nr:unnamed protein product [Rotaria magnacalcarata]CAF2143157.1 unnamed protein product [Rotaria magnacalcarata]CAF3804334.1 unnamed protein product [Rotaria magnacalcarata]CAF3872936.1 unnamed protein product [Rotaria magnacalcarata]